MQITRKVSIDGSWSQNVSNFKILCVEDNREAQRMLTFLLTKAGYEVITAEDGPQGIEKAKAWRPALILVDMMMPGMTGTEVIRRLRADPINKDVPMLVLSAYNNPALIEEALAAGADDYLIKTISLDELTQVIDDYLRVGQTMLTRRRVSPSLSAAPR
jgi:CheY-like chemotaxis protein